MTEEMVELTNIKIIDSNVFPEIPDLCYINSHKEGGIIEFTPETIFLYASRKQKDRPPRKCREEISLVDMLKKPPLNPGSVSSFLPGLSEMIASARNFVSITGYELIKILEKKPVLNATVLDHLLKHQELIPADLEGEKIFFWGTIYEGMDEELYVRYMNWGNDRKWRGELKCLDSYFDHDCMAALQSNLIPPAPWPIRAINWLLC